MVGEIGQTEKVQIEDLRNQAKKELSDWQKRNDDRIARTKKTNRETGNADEVNVLTPESRREKLNNFKMNKSRRGMSYEKQFYASSF